LRVSSARLPIYRQGAMLANIQNKKHCVFFVLCGVIFTHYRLMKTFAFIITYSKIQSQGRDAPRRVHLKGFENKNRFGVDLITIL
jgi:hypothetical protein